MQQAQHSWLEGLVWGAGSPVPRGRPSLGWQDTRAQCLQVSKRLHLRHPFRVCCPGASTTSTPMGTLVP